MEFKLSARVRQALDSRYSVPLVLLVVLLAQWAILFSSASPSWDGIYYYSYARSIVFDGDLRIGNDLRLSYPTAPPDFAGAAPDQLTTVTGRTESPFAFGSSLLWLPWLAILRGLAALGQMAGQLPAELTGYEWPFTMGLATLSTLLGWLAFWLAYRLALQVSERAGAALATLTLLFATPLLFYAYTDALFAHATSAFITAIFITAWWRRFRRPDSYGGALAIGLLLGLAALVRWQHIVYVVLPLSSVAGWWLSLAAVDRKPQIRRVLLLALLVGLGAAAVMTLQLAQWRSLYGQWFTVPQGAGFMDWAAPFWPQVLFSPFKGLLPWMPVYFLALAGLLLQLRKHRQFLLPLLIVLLLETYVNSSSVDWFGGGGYGPRRFTGELTILIVGYAALLQWLPGKVRLIVGGLAAALLAVHQWMLLRYGFSEAIGGQLLSMAPDYRWMESDYGAFIRQLGNYGSELLRRPLATLNWPGTPLGLLYEGRFPARHLVALAATGLFVALCWLAASRLMRREANLAPRNRWIVLLLLLIVIIGADIWLLTFA